MSAVVDAGAEIPKMSTRDFHIPWVKDPLQSVHRDHAVCGIWHPDPLLVPASAEQAEGVGEG